MPSFAFSERARKFCSLSRSSSSMRFLSVVSLNAASRAGSSPHVVDTVLASAYALPPSFWTSTSFVPRALRRMKNCLPARSSYLAPKSSSAALFMKKTVLSRPATTMASALVSRSLL